MRFREQRFNWKWSLPVTPEQFWPLIADTRRFNRDSGIPAIELPESGIGSDSRRIRTRQWGVAFEWDEEPFTWEMHRYFQVIRTFRAGPLKTMTLTASLKPLGQAGCELSYGITLEPAGISGVIASPVAFGLISARKIDATVRRYAALAAANVPSRTESVAASKRPTFAPGGEERLRSLTDELETKRSSTPLVRRLAESIQSDDDIALNGMRPYELADRWKLGRKEVLEVCLRAAKLGILDARWDVVCPGCQGAKQRRARLGELDRSVHCDSCNIDVATDLSDSIEITFRPNAAIRPIDAAEYCVGGPGVTPHILAQQKLETGQSRELALPLNPGLYRIRRLGAPGEHRFRVESGGQSVLSAGLAETGIACAEPMVAPDAPIRLENVAGSTLFAIVERVDWIDRAATAADVTVLQEFRDLFAADALRQDERLEVGNLAVVFTDLKGSTRLYREVGDAPAFGLVMGHFDILRDAVAAEDGAIVKTIGDAVMAVFRRPANAIRAMLRAQAALKSSPDNQLVLKAGIHFGPCLAVNLNDRLDYFGTTVNTAARLEGQSSGEDIVISQRVFEDPEVKAALASAMPAYRALAYESGLKGFDETFQLWRIEPADVAELME